MFLLSFSITCWVYVNKITNCNHWSFAGINLYWQHMRTYLSFCHKNEFNLILFLKEILYQHDWIWKLFWYNYKPHQNFSDTWIFLLSDIEELLLFKSFFHKNCLSMTYNLIACSFCSGKVGFYAQYKWYHYFINLIHFLPTKLSKRT
mgnify:CR=1 FL=1